MNDRELFDAIRAAGEVPPPPARDAAFERAMDSIRMPGRGMRRALTALVAAAVLVVPAGVFQTVGGLVDDPGSHDIVRPFTATTPEVSSDPQARSHDTDAATPGDRDSVLTDPQPSHGKDDKGHNGKGDPCGPSEDKAGEHLDNRKGPCASS